MLYFFIYYLKQCFDIDVTRVEHLITDLSTLKCSVWMLSPLTSALLSVLLSGFGGLLCRLQQLQAGEEGKIFKLHKK